MSLRIRILLAGLVTMLAATLIMGRTLAQHEEDVYEQELRNMARVLLASLASPCVPALAHNEFAELDRIVEQFRLRMAGASDVEWVAVLDRNGRVVGHTDERMYGRLLADDFTTHAMAAHEPLFRSVGTENRALMVAMPIETQLDELPGIRWGTLTARLSLERARQEVHRIWWGSLKLMGLFGLLAALLFYVVAEILFLRPVSRLSAAAEAIREGDLTRRAQIRGSGEMAALGRTFDRMAGQLQGHTEGLQKQVDERTRKLNRTNQELVSTMSKLRDANRRLEEMARTDALTGLYNRRHMTEALAHHFALARRGNHPLAFAMIDVDHFKRYNDTHGHPQGDRILRALSDILAVRVRQTDVVCRYGGEEFAIMFPDTSAEQARVVVEELRRRVAEHPFEKAETQPEGRLTVSIGLAELDGEMGSPEDLVAHADQALYVAKEQGRNRVHWVRNNG